jgi:hypothetical protein
MKVSARSAVLCAATLTGALLLGACGKHDAAAPATPAAASTAVTAPAPMPAPASTAPAAPAASSTAAKSMPAAASTAAAAAPAAAPAAAAAETPLTVAKVTLGDAVNTEHQVTHAGSSFATNDKILYASVATEGRSSGATLNAKWSYLEGSGQMISSVSQSIATDGPAVTTFKVQNPDLWPEGKYKVEISLDGKSVSEQNFEIKKR